MMRALSRFASAFLTRWSDARCTSRAAALSFYAAFSLGPILVIVVTVGSLLADTSALTASILSEIEHLVGEQGRALAQAMLENAQSSSRGLYALVAAGALLVGATTAFAELKDSLDDIFKNDRPPEKAALWQLLRTRLLSLGLVMTLAFLMLVALVANAALSAGAGVIAGYIGTDDERLLKILSEVATIAGTYVLFTAIYKLLPARHLSWKRSLSAAAFTTVLFNAGRIAIGLYLGHSDVAKSFGPAGSLAIVLLWVDYAALAFLAGAVLASQAPVLHELWRLFGARSSRGGAHATR